MSKTNILIVEDEAITAEDLRETLEKMGYAVSGIAHNVESALEIYRQHGTDIFIVDITLKGTRTGIDLGQIISTEFKKPFIFLTSHTDETIMQQARACDPGSYLVKPYKKEELFMAIELALQHGNAKHTAAATDTIATDSPDPVYRLRDAVFIKDGYSFIRLKEDDIFFLKSEGVYLEIHARDKMHLVRDSFKNMVARFTPGKFLQVHKSYLINTDHLQEVNPAYVRVNEKEIPVGKTHRDEVFKKLGI